MVGTSAGRGVKGLDTREMPRRRGGRGQSGGWDASRKQPGPAWHPGGNGGMRWEQKMEASLVGVLVRPARMFKLCPLGSGCSRQQRAGPGRSAGAACGRGSRPLVYADPGCPAADQPSAMLGEWKTWPRPRAINGHGKEKPGGHCRTLTKGRGGRMGSGRPGQMGHPLVCGQPQRPGCRAAPSWTVQVPAGNPRGLPAPAGAETNGTGWRGGHPETTATPSQSFMVSVSGGMRLRAAQGAEQFCPG